MIAAICQDPPAQLSDVAGWGMDGKANGLDA
jgi:hypothetical protein